MVYWWLFAFVAVSKAPNCVVQLQKQFSSSASKKHKAALQRGQVCVQPFWQHVALNLRQYRVYHPRWPGRSRVGQQHLEDPSGVEGQRGEPCRGRP